METSDHEPFVYATNEYDAHVWLKRSTITKIWDGAYGKNPELPVRVQLGPEGNRYFFISHWDSFILMKGIEE